MKRLPVASRVGARGRVCAVSLGSGYGEAVLVYPGTDDSQPVVNLADRSYVCLEGFTFRGCSHGKCAVDMTRSSHCIVTCCRFEQLCNADVSTTWNANAVIWMGNSVGCIVSGNVFRDVTGDGIALNGQSARHNLVSGNAFADFSGKRRSWEPSNLYSRCVDVQDMSEGDNVIAFNVFENCPASIWLDRDGSRNVVLRNRADNGGDFVFSESRCVENVVVENIAVGMSGTGYQTARYETGWTTATQWTGNVAYGCSTGFLIHKSYRDCLRQNIVTGSTSCDISFSDSALANGPHVFFHNLVYTAGRSASVRQERSGLL